MQISFSLPESQFVTETPEAVTQKIRSYAALGLYQAGELSIGAASELACIAMIFWNFASAKASYCIPKPRRNWKLISRNSMLVNNPC